MKTSNSFKKKRLKFKINYNFPVVVVCRSNKYTSAQVLEPITKKTLKCFSSKSIKTGTKSESAKALGGKIAEYLQEKKYSQVVFDRNGLVFTGRVKALADGISENKIVI
jgi:large subunit ribosomal protein L18